MFSFPKKVASQGVRERSESIKSSDGSPTAENNFRDQVYESHNFMLS
jgi:hypothetical protein